MDIDVKNLHPLEVRLLRAVKKGESITTERITDELGYKVGQCNQAFSWLTAKGCLEETKREKKTLYELTDLGREWQKNGMPVERIFSFIKETPSTMPEISEKLGLEKSDTGSAFGLYLNPDVPPSTERRRLMPLPILFLRRPFSNVPSSTELSRAAS